MYHQALAHKLHKCGENTREESARAQETTKGERPREREDKRGGEGEEVEEEEEKGRILGAGNERGINLGLVPN